MKRTKILFSVLIFFLVYAFAPKPQQNKKTDFEKYNKLVWNAMLQYKEAKYEKALTNFQKAFEIIADENVSDYFYAAASAFHLHKPNVAKELIIQSIEQMNTSKDYFLSYEEFNPFRNTQVFTDIEQNYDEHISNFYANLEYPEIYKEVDSLTEVDQKYRQRPIDWEITSKHDSLNIIRLIEITKKYGWYDKGWIILWHQRQTYGESNYVWDFFKPYIDKGIDNGEIRKRFWTNFEDHENMFYGDGTQIFGTYVYNFDDYPVKNVKQVDKKRDSVGLPPLWYLNKVYDRPIPKGYKKTTTNKVGFAGREKKVFD